MPVDDDLISNADRRQAPERDLGRAAEVGVVAVVVERSGVVLAEGDRGSFARFAAAAFEGCRGGGIRGEYEQNRDDYSQPFAHEHSVSRPPTRFLLTEDQLIAQSKARYSMRAAPSGGKTVRSDGRTGAWRGARPVKQSPERDSNS